MRNLLSEVHPGRRPGNVISTKVLTEAGVSHAELRRLVGDGMLTRLRRGWYAAPGADTTVSAAIRAGGVLGCGSALTFHGAWRPLGKQLHVYRTRHGRAAAASYCPAPRCRHPFPVAVVPIDVAVRQARLCLAAEELIAQVESLVMVGRLGLAEAEHLLGPALAGRLDVSGSGTETLVRLRLRQKRVKLRPQAKITSVGWVDFLIGDRLVVEVDSFEHHTSRDSYHNDRRRDLRLVELGYTVVRLTWQDVMLGWEAACRSILALIRAGKHLGRPRPC
ncbi:MAG: DUF559 domain-containing protein [Propionibacterium sp.]|nr:DUF559 domain-containing protein [Propionibacterium sp.]